MDPTYAPALMAKAALQQQRGNARSAGVIYDAILGRTPDFAPAQKQLAALYLRTSTNLAEAYDLALKARNTNPDDPELIEIAAELTYERKDYVHALLLLQESGRMKPLPPKRLYYQGMCQLQTMQRPQGLATLKRDLANGLEEPFAAEARNLVGAKD